MYRNLLIMALAFGLAAGCSRMLFVPSAEMVRTPADIGLDYDDVRLVAPDGTALHAWHLKAAGERRGSLLFLHGNAENISTHVGSVLWLPAQGYDVLMLDYRGFGQSQGNPVLPDVLSDIETAFVWLLQQPDLAAGPIFLLGQSLGASMGGYVAGTSPLVNRHVDGVILDAGFARYRSIAREIASRHWLTWLFQWPASWGMPDNYDLIDAIGNISPVPLLLIHGTTDEVVPFDNLQLLYDAASPPKEKFQYDGPHIATFSLDVSRQTLLNFLQRYGAS